MMTEALAVAGPSAGFSDYEVAHDPLAGLRGYRPAAVRGDGMRDGSHAFVVAAEAQLRLFRLRNSQSGLLLWRDS